MNKKKLKLYYRVLVHIFFNYLYGKILIPKKNQILLKKEKINNSIYKTYDNKKYNLYKITDGRIFTDNNENVAVIKNNFILPNVSFQQMNGKLETVKHNITVKQGTSFFIKRIKGKVFNLCQGASGNNYFHFIFDILPKIYLLSSKIDLQKINYFYVSDPNKLQIKIFSILGINKKKLLSSKKFKHIIAEEIYAVDHPWYNEGYVQKSCQKIPKWTVYKNRKVFLSNYRNNIKKVSKKKIFLDRSSSKYNHCQIKNLIDIKKIILEKKLKIYKPEFLSFKEQINLFKNSSIIIGAHGAAFSNIIFCKPGTKIIEIIPADHPNRIFERFSKILKLRYFRIETKPDNFDANYPFRINLNQKNLNFIKKIIEFK